MLRLDLSDKYMIESGSGEYAGANFHAPNDNEIKEQYRAAVEQAAFFAASYDGTEQKYRELMAALEGVEEFVRSRQDSLDGEGLYQKEVALAKKWQFTEAPLTISDLLEEAHESRKNKINEGQAGLLWKKIQGIILPPGKNRVPFVENGKETEPKDLRFEERLEELFGILQDTGVFTDDVIITEGVLDPSMVRSESYLCVEIPRLERIVLVCNQVGEATFVIKGNFSIDTLSTFSKEELLDKYPGQVQRIVRTSFDAWKREIVKNLLSDSDGSIGEKTREKVDVRSYEQLRAAVQAKYTPEWWVKASSADIRLIEVGGKKITSIGSVFGSKAAAVDSRYYFLLVGQKIWGTEEPHIKKVLEIETRSKEQWSEAIKKQFTPKQWIGFKISDRLPLRIDGKSLMELGTIFGIVGIPASNFLVFLKLGQAIWGPDEPIIKKALEIEERTPEEWVREIQKIYVPETWVKMGASAESRRAIEINGVKVSALGVILGILNNPREEYLSFLELGQKIWGPDEPIIKKAVEIEKRTPEEWVWEIQKIYNPQSWIKIKFNDKRSVAVDGKSLSELGAIFGTFNNPARNVPAFLELGQKIWGPDEPIIKKAIELENRSIEDWALAIQKKYSPEQCVKFTQDERQLMEIDGKQLGAIGILFGIGKMVRANKLAFLKLCQLIWPDNTVISNAIEGLGKGN